MNKKINFSTFLFVILYAGLLVFYGQACTQNTNLNSFSLKMGADVSGGNGDGYEGKLLFAHIEPGFTCEGKNAPTIILRKNTDKQWYFTRNARDKCADISNQLVTDVNYNPNQSIVSYNNIELVQLMPTPWDNISLANAELQFPLSPTINTPMSCPTNYIPIPARTPYTSQNFCVSQFEMKIQGLDIGIPSYYDSVFVPESRPDGTPWGSILRDDAITECQSLGSGFDLISNDQWQTIAQNAELQGSNWTSLSVGTEGMYRGNSDASSIDPLSILNTNDYYDQTGNNASELAGFGKEQRRVHFLSNGKIIWDLAGNASEWVKDNFTFAYGADRYISAMSDILFPLINPENGRTAKIQFGPVGNYEYLNSGENGGMGYAWFLTGGNEILRGQDNNDMTATGVFTTRTGLIATDKSTSTGFRCVYNP